MEVKSVVFCIVNNEGDENLSFGNYKYFEKIRKTQRELVWYIGLVQTEEDFQHVMNLPPEELLYVLLKFKEDHSNKVFYPN